MTMRPGKKHILCACLASAAGAAPLAGPGGSAHAEAIDPGRRQGMAVSAPAGASRIQDHFRRLRIPVFQPFDYKPAQRDPFLDPSVQVTLLGAKKQEFAARPKPIEEYLHELGDLAKRQYAIQGIAYDPDSPMALLGDKAHQVGDKLMLKLGSQGGVPVSNPPASPGGPPGAGEQNLMSRLYATARFYALGIEDDLRSGDLQLTVKRITPDSVVLRVPGCERELTLTYEKDLKTVTTIYASTYGSGGKGKVQTTSTTK
ncbi:MAG: hypothetical protein JO015_01025 [Verrucomicrobia bacterium]|nr:hypothetical protein [Verrucomicrobiota bacterium]